MKSAASIGLLDVVDAERPREPPNLRFVCLPVVRVEQPPAAHVRASAVGGHDVLVWLGRVVTWP